MKADESEGKSTAVEDTSDTESTPETEPTQPADTATSNLLKGVLQWAAFYSDCLHEVLPVKSGIRVTITYSILVNADEESGWNSGSAGEVLSHSIVRGEKWVRMQ